MPSDPCRDLLLAVRELHLLGYERIRIAPFMSPSGAHWRCSIAPASNTLVTHGARLAGGSLAASYSSASARAYFGWSDVTEAAPRRLAETFVERFPEIAAAGRGADPAYAAWYVEMLRITEPDALPIAFADWPTPDDCMTTVGAEPERRVPLPPPGEAAGDRHPPADQGAPKPAPSAAIGMKGRALVAGIGVLLVAGAILAYLRLARGDPSSWPASRILARLREDVPSAAVLPGPFGAARVSGEYRFPAPARGGKGGDHLYICPDGTYLLASFTDAHPERLDETGRWAEDEGFLRFDRDASPSDSRQRNRRYLPFTAQPSKDLLLLGREHDFVEFLAWVTPKDAVGDLLESCFERVRRADDASCAEARRRLLPAERR